MVTCRLARPERAARWSASRSESSARAAARSCGERRRRVLQRLRAGADGQVPDRRQQAVRAEHADQPGVLDDHVLARDVQPGQRVEQLVLGLGHHPAQVLLGADVGPVRRLDLGQPRGRVGGGVRLLERGGEVVLLLDVGDPELEAVVDRDVERLARSPGPAAAGPSPGGAVSPTTPGSSASIASCSTAPRSRDGSPKLCWTCSPSQSWPLSRTIAGAAIGSSEQRVTGLSVPLTLSGSGRARAPARASRRCRTPRAAPRTAVRRTPRPRRPRLRGRPCSACRSRTGTAAAGRPRRAQPVDLSGLGTATSSPCREDATCRAAPARTPGGR